MVWKTRLTVLIFALAVTTNGEEPKLTRDPFTGISALAVCEDDIWAAPGMHGFARWNMHTGEGIFLVYILLDKFNSLSMLNGERITNCIY